MKPLGTLRGVVERVILPMCDAVHHANHKEGVLHRDVTPTNVLVDGQDLRPYLIDFGVCTLLEAKNPHLKDLPSEASLSLSGGKRTVSGTLVFMPPEQIQGKADRRGDVWGLGALLHFLVTGEPPVAPAAHSTVPVAQRREGLTLLIEQAEREGNAAEAAEFRRKLEDLEAGRERTREEVALDVAKGVYKPRPAWVDPAFDAVIAKAMAVDPELRYRNAKELGQDLEAWLAGRTPLALAEQKGGTAHALYASRQTLKRWRWAARWPSLRSWRLAVGVIVWRDASAEREREECVAEARSALRRAVGHARDDRSVGRSSAGGRAVTVGVAMFAAPKAELVAEVERAAWALLEVAPRDAAALAELAWCTQMRAKRKGLDDLEQALEAIRTADRAGKDDEAADARARLRLRLSDLLPAAAEAVPHAWQRLLDDRRSVVLPALGSDAEARFHRVLPDGRLDEGRAAVEGENGLTPGRWVLALVRAGRRVHTPFEVPRPLERVEVAPATDPAAAARRHGLRAGRARAGAAGRDARGRRGLGGHRGDRRALRRLARHAGPRGAGAARAARDGLPGRGGAPSLAAARRALRASQGRPEEARGRRLAPRRAGLRPGGRSRRLPTAQEWAWAATGPFGASCALGALERLFGDVACLGPCRRGPT